VVGMQGAHSREVSAVFSLRASPMSWAPSSPMPLAERLRGPNKEPSLTSAPPLVTTKRANLAAVMGMWGAYCD
jgi:hypothetical protein